MSFGCKETDPWKKFGDLELGELDSEEELGFVPSRPLGQDLTSSMWMECVFCGSFLPVLTEDNPLAPPFPKIHVVLDHVRNFTEVPYRPYICGECEEETRFCTKWSLDNHKTVQHEQEETEDRTDRSRYLDKLSKLYAKVVTLNEEEKKAGTKPEDALSLKILDELKNVPGCPSNLPEEPTQLSATAPMSSILDVSVLGKEELATLANQDVSVKREPVSDPYEWEDVDTTGALLNRCSKCLTLGGEAAQLKIYETDNEKINHAKIHARQYKTNDLEYIYRECFGTDSPRKAMPPAITERAHPVGSSERQTVTTPTKRGRQAQPPEYDYEWVIEEIRQKFTANWGRGASLQCALCDDHRISSVNKWIIASHLFTHLHARPFKCVRCEKGSNNPANLKDHIKRCHPDLLAETKKYYVDRRGEMDAEISQVARQCYWAVLNA